jgi:hypothetical protein
MKKYMIVLAAVLWGFSACSEKLDLAPANAITQEQIMEMLASGDEAKADLIIGSLASAFPTWITRNTGYGSAGSDSRVNSFLNLQYVQNLQGLDIVDGFDNQNGFGLDAYQWNGKQNRGNTNNFNVSYWAEGWKCVAEANRVLDLLPDEIIVNSKNMKGYKAAALTLRAFAYNFLMENYRGAYSSGGEGLMIYDKLVIGDGYKPVSTAGETYDLIKQDLANAVRLFPESGIGENGDGYTANTKDLDLGVANFVRARVSLLTGDYSTAIAAADAILAKYPDLIPAANYGGRNTGTATEPAFMAADNAFLNNEHNPEVIFGFARQAGAFPNTWLNVFGTGLGGVSSHDYARIGSPLYDLINANDVRKGIFLNGNTIFPLYDYSVFDPNAGQSDIPTYSNLKYAATHGIEGKDDTEKQTTTSLGTLDICYMRTSEVLLVKAEAQAKNGDEAGAKATLNKLLAARSADGSLTVDNYGGASSVLDAVKLQWRIEMWGENGLEYYNNKRWGVDVTRSTSTSNHRFNTTITVDMMTLDIPANELMYNPNLK